MSENFEKKKNLFWISATTITLIIVSYFIYSFHSYKIKKNEEIEVYYANYFGEPELAIINEFNSRNLGDIKIVPINLSFDMFSTNERKELFTRALRSKSDRIDIFAVDYIWASRFVRWAEPLGNHFSIVERNKILDEAMNVCYFDNKVVAMPLQIDIQLMYYRDDILKKNPNYKEIVAKLDSSITWQDFIKLGKEYAGKNPFYLFPADSYEGLVCSFYEMILNQNPNFFDNKEIDFTRPEAHKALKLLVDFVNKYNFTPDTVSNFQENETGKYFVENDGVFHRNWPQFDFHLSTKFKYKDREIFKTAPLPHFKGTKPAYVFGGWNLMISKYSKNKLAAIKFIKYLLSEETQQKLLHTSSALPVIKSLYDTEPSLEFYKNIFRNGAHRPMDKDYTRVSDIASHFAKKAIEGEIGVDKALRSMNEYVKSNKMIIH